MVSFSPAPAQLSCAQSMRPYVTQCLFTVCVENSQDMFAATFRESTLLVQKYNAESCILSWPIADVTIGHVRCVCCCLMPGGQFELQHAPQSQQGLPAQVVLCREDVYPQMLSTCLCDTICWSWLICTMMSGVYTLLAREGVYNIFCVADDSGSNMMT